MNEKEINTIIRNRRSVYPKQYTGGVVSRETIGEILVNANWAPNHKRTQPWRFHVFMGKGLQRLADFQSNLYKENSIKRGDFDQVKFEKLKTTPLKAACIIAVCMKRSDPNLIPEIEEIIATGCAIENIYLSLPFYGLGGYMSTGGGTYDPQTKSFLGLEEADKLIGYFYIGTFEGPVEEKSRKPVEERITWIED